MYSSASFEIDSFSAKYTGNANDSNFMISTVVDDGEDTNMNFESEFTPRNADVFTQDSQTGPPLCRNTSLKPRVAASPVRKRKSGGKSFFLDRFNNGGNSAITSLNNNAFSDFNRSDDNSNQGIFANHGINSGLGPVTSVFQFSQDSCSNSNSQFSQDFTDRFGSFNVRSQYGDNCTLNLSNSEDSNISFDMNCSSRPTSMRGVLNSVNSSHGNGNSMKNNSSNKNITLAQETRQIDIPQPLKNVFVEKALYEDDAEAFANRFGGNGGSRRPTKMWISAFRERSRYLSDFEEICVLGEGTFSSVFCVRHRLDGTLYAIKRLNQKIIHENQGKLMMREVNALSVLRGCPSIIQYYGCWLDDHHLCIQTELCHLGSLEDIISPTPSQSSVMSLASNNNSFQIGGSVSFKAMNGHHECVKENQPHVVMGISEDLAWLLLNDICGALEFMHKKGIVHMDLRPANCFLSMGHGHHGGFQALSKFADDKVELRKRLEHLIVCREFQVKVGDMGHACPLDEKGIIEGEDRYCARELINSEGHNLDLTKADMFSLGASVYELCLGRFLGSGGSATEEWHNLRDGNIDMAFTNNYSGQLLNVMHHLMHSNPSTRPTSNATAQNLASIYPGQNKGIIFNRNKSNEDASHREIYKSPTSVSSVNMFSANKENINRPIADNFHHAGTPLHKK